MTRSTEAATLKFDRRASGLLLHPTSLPGRFGSGDLGPQAHAFVDFLAAAGQRWWQMLPVGPAGEGHSPYSASSAFAGYSALVSPERLVGDRLLKPADIDGLPRFSDRRVEHQRMLRLRTELLRRAFERFCAARGPQRHDFQAFIALNEFWLEDFALFAALQRANGDRPWSQWEKSIRTRQPAALARASAALRNEVLFQKFVQFEFDRQWTALRKRCASRRVGLIGDIPIFVAHDSADVWANPDLFILDGARRPKVVSGCPPDFFNANGQRWAHPHYDWKTHAGEGYRWWIERFRRMLRLFDAVRIDHFLGFHRAWHIPARSSTARHGRYVPGPGAAFFHALRKKLGDVPIIAEDLGSVTPEALALRDRFHFPGMRVLQFGFGDGGEYHLPHNFARRSVVYTGTHDNDTTAGWLRKLPANERRRVLRYTGIDNARDVSAVTSALIRTALASVADTAIFPVQDLLALGSESRMNIPGTPRNNWGWRLPPDNLGAALGRRLRELCELYERA